MKVLFAALLFLTASVSGLSAANSRVPVMVLPFENKTEIKTLDRFTAWIKADLANYDNIRIIDFYKSTNINGTLLLFLKPSQEFLFGKPKANTTTAQNIPDTYYIVTGTISYTDFRYYVHADVINSATEWVIAKDDVYISDAANIRKLLVQELGRRLSMKMNFKQVEVFNEQRVLAMATNTNQTNQTNQASILLTNKQASVVQQPKPLPAPIEQQNFYNEKKQVMIVFNTNERKVLEDLKKKQTNAAPDVTRQEDTNQRGYRRPDKLKQAKLDGEKPEFHFYNSDYHNEIAVHAMISATSNGVAYEGSNVTFMSFAIGYKYQILPSFYIGIDLGFGLFDLRSYDMMEAAYQFNIYEFRVIPQILYRWYFFKPFFIDVGLGAGGHFGNAVKQYTPNEYLPYTTNANITDTLSGFIVQGRAGAGVELGRFTFGLYFEIEGQQISYASQVSNSSFVNMTTIGLSAGVEF